MAAWALEQAQILQQTHRRLHPELDGVIGVLREAAWGVVRLQQDLALSSFLSRRSGLRLRRMVQCYLGPGSLALLKRVAFG